MLTGPLVSHVDSRSEVAMLDRRLREYARHRAALDAAEAFDLARAEEIGLHRFFGCVTLWEYFERVLGYAPHTARERMRVARALVKLPVLSRKLATGELAYSAVRELTRVATDETEEEWIAAAADKTVHEIEQLVAHHVPGDSPDDPEHADLRRREVRLRFTTEIYALWRQARVALEEELGHELGELELVELLCRRSLEPGTGADRPAHQIAYKQCNDCKRATQNGGGIELDIYDAFIERAHCDAEILGSLDAPAPERKTTTVTPRIRQQVFHRDMFCCTVPGCRSRRNLEIHHLREQSRGGGHELSNVTLICSGHHAALHAGLLKLSGTAPSRIYCRWTFPAPLPTGLDPEARARMIDERLAEMALDVPRGTRKKRETPYPLSVCRKAEESRKK